MHHKEQVDLLITGHAVMTMNAHREIIPNGAVAVQQDTIVAVGPTHKLVQRYTAQQQIDVPHDIILPGFINGHTHAAMSLFRGVADDVSLHAWLRDAIFPLEHSLLDADFVYWGTKLAALEMIRCGITTAVDMYYYEDSTAQAFAELGMRAITGATIAKTNKDVITAEEHLKRWQGHALITPALAPHALPSVPEELLKQIARISEQYNSPVLMHVAETEYDAQFTSQIYDVRPIAVLEQLQLLNQKLIIAHAVHLNETDIQKIARAHVGVIHCPTSNMKLASGTAPVSTLCAAGVAVGLGTDGAASNNALSIIAEMKAALLMQRIATGTPHVFTALQAIECATIEGARAIHMSDNIGSLEPGKKADIISIQLDALHQIPVYDPVSTLVFATYPSDVQTVIINGKVHLLHGEFTYADSVILDVYKHVETYKQKIAAHIPT